MKRFSVILWSVVLIPLLASSAQAVLIDFNALGINVTVTNQFPEATFSSTAGYENRTAADFDFGPAFSPYYICTAAIGGGLNCKQPTFVDFTNPVHNLSFYALGDNTPGNQAKVDVYENFAFSGTVDVTVDADFWTPHLVDLTGFSNVTRIEIYDITDASGLAWDNFSFDIAAVPEPTTMLLLGTGLVVLGGFTRKFRM